MSFGSTFYRKKEIKGINCYGKLKSSHEVTVEAIQPSGDGEFREFVWPKRATRWTQLVDEVKAWAEAFDFDIEEIWSGPGISRDTYVESGDYRILQSDEIPQEEFDFIMSLTS